MPGARSIFVAPMFEPEVYRKEIYCIEGSNCEIVGTFRRPQQIFGAPTVIWRPYNDPALGELCPLAPPVVNRP